MKKTFQLCFCLGFFAFGFSQELKPIAQKVKNSQQANKTFVKYDLFSTDKSAQKKALYESAADDITVMKLNKSEIKRITTERPEALEMSFPFEGKDITVELVKSNIFTQDFKVNTDKGYVNYTPGVYYNGIVKGDEQSLVAISFFKDDVMGVTSITGVGNIVIGKVKDSEDFVTYNDQKLRGTNSFACGADELAENKNIGLPTYNPKVMSSDKKTNNCVRIYYEAAYNIYTNKGSSIANVTDWVTAMQNNIYTLYNNDRISIALSEVFVWTSTDPYTGSDTSTRLNQFRTNRTSFNGDVGQLIKYRNPVSGGIAWVNALCGTYNYSYVDVALNYSNVPTYSWNIEAMAHETGHNLGSSHTHACVWNGNNTAIDGCGPASGNDEGCTGPLPTGTGGTIMSYCHLVSSVGINFNNGFGEQPAELIRNRVDSSGCVGTDCLTSCTTSVSALTINTVTNNTLAATITDNTGTSWKYRFTKTDGTIVSEGTTTNKVLNFNNLQEGTYYILGVGNNCSAAYEREQLTMTDANWCSGIVFTDSGGENRNYMDNLAFTKTFYPTNSGDKLKLTFSQFDVVSGDFMNVYNGPTIASPRFTGGTQVTGNTIPGPFESTHATGAITVRFNSNSSGNASGWKSNFECVTLATKETNAGSSVNISPNPTKGSFTITSKDKIVSYDLYDATGKIMKKTSKLNSGSEKVDLSANPAGTYVITVTTEKETVTKKVVKY